MPNGEKLPSGTYPEQVRWAQGHTLITYNMRTGQVSYGRNLGNPHADPVKTLKVLTITKERPLAHELKLGFEDIEVTDTALTFRRNSLAAPRQIHTPSLRRRGL